MAIALTSRFNPFTFDEMVKPLLYYKEAYDKVDNELTNLSAQADYWKNIANRENSPEAYRLYTEFENALNNTVDSFSQGLRQGNLIPRQLSEAKRRYSSNILPIQEAYKAREEDRKLQAEMLAKDPSMMFSRYASQSNLDSYLNGQRPDYKSVSGTDLYNRALKGATGISARRFQEREGRAFAGDYFKLTKEYGYSPAEAAQILADPKKYPEFNQLINSIINGSGVSSLTAQDRVKAIGRIMEGINAGIVYKQDSSLQDNWRAKLYLQNSIKGSNKSKTPRGETLNINRGTVNFVRDTTRISNLLDNNGRIKTSTIQGGTTQGPSMTSIYQGSVGAGVSKAPRIETFNSKGTLNLASNYAKDIQKTLLDAGVPLETINKMTQPDIERALSTLKNNESLDIVPTNMYRFPFNAEATKGIIELVNNTRGDKFKEVQGYDEKGNLKIGEGKTLEYEDGKRAEGYYDPSTDKWFLLMDGTYHLMPENTLSTSTYDIVSRYSKSLEDLNNIVDVLDSKIAKGEELSDREMILYNEALANVEIIDEYFGTVGNQLADVIGPRNVNTNR